MTRPVVMYVGSAKVRLVIVWSGSIAAIPAGWQLCDGSGGTLDLRDRFVMGLSYADGNLGDTGGQDTQAYNHYHPLGGDAAVVADASHVHPLVNADASWPNAEHPNIGGHAGDNEYNTTTGQTHTHAAPSPDPGTEAGTSHTHSLSGYPALAGVTIDNRPPYYALAYISGACTPPVGSIVMYASAFERAWYAEATGGYDELATTLSMDMSWAEGTYPPAPFMVINWANDWPEEQMLVQSRTVVGASEYGGDLEEWSVVRGYNGTLAQPIGAWNDLCATVLPVPTGYLLCDGTAGTPDLGDSFLVGAGGDYAPGDWDGGYTLVDVHSHSWGTLGLASASHGHNSPIFGGVQGQPIFSEWNPEPGDPDPPEPGPAVNHFAEANSSYALHLPHRHYVGLEGGSAAHGHALSGSLANGARSGSAVAPSYTLLAFLKRVS